LTTIWRETGFVENDPWVIETDDRIAGEGERVLVPLNDIAETGETVNEGLGILLTPDDDPEALRPYLERIDLIALTFPAFSDGRAFSQSTYIRDRLGYTGELRAVGDVLIDPLVFMLRCGISSFAIENETAIRRLREGRLPEVNRYYQPATRKTPSAGRYSWRHAAKI